jgi:hypothetical protein
MQLDVTNGDKVVKLHKWFYNVVQISAKLIFLCVGLYLFFILKNECLFNPNANIVVTIYIALLSLACFQGIGVPIDRLINTELLKP